ncbi:HNH endonuclease [Nostocaceae cyanobacterium CENA369]|uniref:HNH endonuclease n=1 Tax=Dendronalium phyllosphericum CENA369 TaxID=1725256 RepID=A0A8J7LFF1_9NOST|nr:HNH endonuclease [Dendronalium phyllosphericum]MBH8575141.1 HNH endonuclease [Dendronalium phyllosphericum CENA369]
MTISQRDIKLLWGRAASRCAFPSCRLQLTQDSETTSSSILIGEQAHIVAKESNGPRGNSLLTPDERDSYDNLILLCPTHHTIIDKNVEDFPIEKLHALKTNHELWVRQTLSQTWDLNQQARDIIYTSLIDSAVENCHLLLWKQWTLDTLRPIPRWPYELPEHFLEFRLKVISTDFPGTLTELERSVKTLSMLLDKATRVFQKHCNIAKDNDGNLFYDADQFYQISESQEFNDWVEECYQPIIDSTKAANWFREVVRRDINPMFFAAEGKFIATYPFTGDIGLSPSYLVPVYTQEEKDSLPDSLSEYE